VPKLGGHTARHHFDFFERVLGSLNDMIVLIEGRQTGPLATDAIEGITDGALHVAQNVIALVGIANYAAAPVTVIASVVWPTSRETSIRGPGRSSMPSRTYVLKPATSTEIR
jgi:hypothetical protein